MIELNGVSKSIAGHPILNNVNLRIRTGEVVALIGPSGAGKTTLLRSINFLERADEGHITVGDLSISCSSATSRDVLAIRRKTAMVFQNYNLFRHRTVLENVMEGLLIVKKMGRHVAKDISMAMLEKVGLENKAQSYPSQLSGGQQQRAGIARALALEPEIILFDEPTSALDPELVGEVFSVIRNLADEGVTMMIVTHELAFARDISNHLVFMENGNIIEQGTSSDIFQCPQHERTQQFLKNFN